MAALLDPSVHSPLSSSHSWAGTGWESHPCRAQMPLSSTLFWSGILPFLPWCPRYLWVCVLSCFGHVRLFAALWTVARQAPLSMGFSRQEYWSGFPCSQGDLPDPGIKPASLPSATMAGGVFFASATWEALSQMLASRNVPSLLAGSHGGRPRRLEGIPEPAHLRGEPPEVHGRLPPGACQPGPLRGASLPTWPPCGLSTASSRSLSSCLPTPPNVCGSHGGHARAPRLPGPCLPSLGLGLESLNSPR